MKENERRMRIAVGMLLVGLLLGACGKEPSVEQQVIATLENMKQDAEAGRHMDFMRYVADDFDGQLGSMDRRDFHRYMLLQMNENRRLYAQFFPIYVQAEGTAKPATEASARFKILITGGGGLLPERGQLFEVETEWKRDGSDWRLLRAAWQPVALPQQPGA